VPGVQWHCTRKEVDPELLVPDSEQTLAGGAIQPWATGHNMEYFNRLLAGWVTRSTST